MAKTIQQLTVPPIKLSTLKENLTDKGIRDNISKSLAKGLTYERLCSMMLIAANKDPGIDKVTKKPRPKKILLCTMQSIIDCMRAIGAFNLDCSGITNEIALVPRKTTLTYQVQYQGYMTLMRRSGNIRDIEAAVVYENDKCLYRRGINTVLEHEPDMSGSRGEIAWAYAIAHYKDGGCHVEPVDKNDLETARSCSTNPYFWNNHPGPMSKKTAVLRLSTFVEWSIEVSLLLGEAISQEYVEPVISTAASVHTGISMEDIEKHKATVEVNEHKEPPLEKPKEEKPKTKPKRAQKKKPQEPQQQEEVDIYDQAVEFVRQRALGGNRVTIPDLKRKLRIGGDQAMRLFERLKRSDIDPAFWEMPIKEEQPPHSADEPKQELPLEQPPKKKAVRESPADRTLRIIAWSDNEIGGVDNRPIGLDDIIWMTCLDTWQELSKEPTIPQMVEASELSNRAASNVIRALQGFWPIGTPEHSDLQRQFEWVSV